MQPSAEELHRAGMLEFACDLGYMDTLANSRAPPSQGGAAARAAEQRRRESVGAAGSMGGGASAANVSKVDPEVARMMAQADASTSEAARDLEGIYQVTEKVKSKVGALERRGKRATTGGTDFIIGRGGSLGLRHFAMKVCKKIEHKKLTTYSEVADELVEEVKDLPEAQGDEKNIRRRVYDAFNVLLAVGIIQRTGRAKDVSWAGFPMERDNELEKVREEYTTRIKAVEEKQQQLQELASQHSTVNQLLQANAARGGASEQDMPLQIPFVLVSAKREATVEVSVSEDMRSVDFTFDAQFSLHDDSYVLKEIVKTHGSVDNMYAVLNNEASSNAGMTR